MKNKNYYKIVIEKMLKQIDSDEYKKKYSENKQKETELNHFLEVVNIVKSFWKDQEKRPLPIALKIAALCHDLDRIYPTREVNTKDCPPNFYSYRKGVHSGNTAIIFLEKNKDLPIKLVHDICYLILRHEGGGDRKKDYKLFERKDEFTKKYNINVAADYLWYADKISFFSSNILEYASRGNEELRKKIIYSINNLPLFAKKTILSFKYPEDIKKIIIELLKI